MNLPSVLVNLSCPFPHLALYDLLFLLDQDLHERLECHHRQGSLSDLLEPSVIQELEHHLHLLGQYLLKRLCHPKFVN